MTQTQPPNPRRGISVSKLYHWIVDGLERTVFGAFSTPSPSRFVSPLGYLGVLTGVTFLALGITGGLLMIYYQPTLTGCGSLTCAFASVERINDSVPYGWLLRNIHYTASNAMVLLAVLHMYYQYFSGRFKIKNEVLWVTGIILGIITGVEAFTGYDLILNQRAGLAIEIGSSLANASPLIGSALRLATFGAGFTDFILRLYAAHVFILPMIMLILVFIHFPRYLVLDIPIVASVVGGIFIIAALFPVPLSIPYSPSNPALTIPEWYLTGIYALLRTEFDKFVMGGLMPALLFLMALVIPFVDTSEETELERQALLHGARNHQHRSDPRDHRLGILHQSQLLPSDPAEAAGPPRALLRFHDRHYGGLLRDDLRVPALHQGEGEGEKGQPRR